MIKAHFWDCHLDLQKVATSETRLDFGQCTKFNLQCSGILVTQS